ncbi:uncharacterized protein [Apostichopus japonicus]|uniref:uncharacterized protein isoform X1 n=1 Tax=Stichopus japonicus TaxID=307972 RepID=UPI003AB200AB
MTLCAFSLDYQVNKYRLTPVSHSSLTRCVTSISGTVLYMVHVDVLHDPQGLLVILLQAGRGFSSPQHVFFFTPKKELLPTLASIKRAEGVLGNETPDDPGLILMVMDYFFEKHDGVFLVMETTATKADAEGKLQLVPSTDSTPVLISCGDILLAERYMLAIDGQVVSNCASFIGGLAMLFASFYIFGIQYSAGTAATIDFIQRCLFTINPDRGHKAQAVKSRRHSINPKVLHFTNAVQDYNTHSF